MFKNVLVKILEQHGGRYFKNLDTANLKVRTSVFINE